MQNSSVPKYALPSASSLFKQSISFYISHFSLIFGIIIVPLILSTLRVFPGQTFSLNLILLTVLYFIAIVIISFVSQLALFSAVTSGSSSVGTAYKKGLSLFFPFIWLNFLITISVLGGFVLFIIPGIIISIWLSQSNYVLFTEGNKGMSALAKSWHYVKGRAGSVFWRFLFLGFIFLLISIVVGLIFGSSTLHTSISQIKSVGQHAVTTTQSASKLSQTINLVLINLIFVPLGIIYGYLVFSALRSTKAEALTEERERRIKKNITIFMIIGILGIVALFMLTGTLLWKLISGFHPTASLIKVLYYQR